MNSLMKQTSSLALNTPEELDGIKKIRETLNEYVSEPYKQKTPTEQVKMREDGFSYPDYAYMLSEMNRLHPIRTEVITYQFFDPKSMTFQITLHVKDVLTGEERCGVGVHGMPAYDAGTENLKPMNKIRMLMNNSFKSAMTLAQRSAWSNFGISSDIYQSQMLASPNTEQHERFELLMLSDVDLKDYELIRWAAWVEKQKENFKKCFESNADEFLDQIEKVIKPRLKSQS